VVILVKGKEMTKIALVTGGMGRVNASKFIENKGSA